MILNSQPYVLLSLRVAHQYLNEKRRRLRSTLTNGWILAKVMRMRPGGGRLARGGAERERQLAGGPLTV